MYNEIVILFFLEFLASQQNHDFIMQQICPLCITPELRFHCVTQILTQRNHQLQIMQQTTFFGNNQFFLYWFYRSMNWNTFISNEVTLSPGWKNMNDRSQSFFYQLDLLYGPESNDIGLGMIMMQKWVVMTLICNHNLAISTFLVISWPVRYISRLLYVYV